MSALRKALDAWQNEPPCDEHGPWSHETTCEHCAREVELLEALLPACAADEKEGARAMSTLAEIIRAQLATGRLRETRALLEALDAEAPLTADERIELAERRADDLAVGLGIVQARRERDEARQSLAERTAEREALCERVSVLEEALAVERSLECDASVVIREAEERGARWALAAADAHVRASAGRRLDRAFHMPLTSLARERAEHGAEVAYSEAHSVCGMDAERICTEARKAGGDE